MIPLKPLTIFSLDERDRNQNVFPFSLSVASMEVNMMIRYSIVSTRHLWPEVQSNSDYHFQTGAIRINNQRCNENCTLSTRENSDG